MCTSQWFPVVLKHISFCQCGSLSQSNFTFAICRFSEWNRIFNEIKWRAKFQTLGNWYNLAGGRDTAELSQVGGKEVLKVGLKKKVVSEAEQVISLWCKVMKTNNFYLKCYKLCISKELYTNPGTRIIKLTGGIFMLALKLNNKQRTHGITFQPLYTL